MAVSKAFKQDTNKVCVCVRVCVYWEAVLDFCIHLHEIKVCVHCMYNHITHVRLHGTRILIAQDIDSAGYRKVVIKSMCYVITTELVIKEDQLFIQIILCFIPYVFFIIGILCECV